VTVAMASCLGKDACGLCFEACPYGSPQFGSEKDAKMQKCDLCLDRWADGKKPACVDGCTTWALDAGPLEELKAKYGDVRDADGFEYSDTLMPSIIFRPKKDTR